MDVPEVYPITRKETWQESVAEEGKTFEKEYRGSVPTFPTFPYIP